MMYALSRLELMHTKCIQNVSHISTNYTFCMQNVYKMYRKSLYTKCIPHFDKLLYTFCIQNLAGIVLLILSTKCIQKLVEIWYIYILYAFCIHQLDTFCTIFV